MTENTLTNQVFLETVHRMAAIAEHALPKVELHLHRVRGYARILADGLGLSETEAETIAVACQLHDIGMVSVPESIIRKTTNLDNEEWDLVRQHPVVGASLIAGMSHPVFEIGEIVAMSHHERWDGSGYPHGLKGDKIPLPGRICGLCDVFDTLTHPRAYKRALTPDEVLLLLQEASESFFDPELVEVFTLKYADILEVREKFKNDPEMVLED